MARWRGEMTCEDGVGDGEECGGTSPRPCSPPRTAALAALQVYIASLEEKLGNVAAEYTVQLHASSSEYLTDLRKRILDDAARRWGEGSVEVEVRSFKVQSSHKAFDLPSLRAFD